jgi:hypothetical protein
MSNILNKLILYWSNSNTISQIFLEIPKFIRNLDYQIKEGFLPLIGIYHINSYKYDINNFLGNDNNVCFHIKTPYEKNNGIELIEGHIMITTHNFLIMEPVEEKSNNKCIIKYAGKINAVEKIEVYEYSEKILENYTCFRIIIDKNICNENIYDKLICIDKKSDDLKDIKSKILIRKDIIINNFKYIEGNDNLDIEDYEAITNIKKKLIEKEANEIVYDEINKCYRKIIEILSNDDDEDVKIYVDELQKFIEDYEVKYLKQKLK